MQTQCDKEIKCNYIEGNEFSKMLTFTSKQWCDGYLVSEYNYSC